MSAESDEFLARPQVQAALDDLFARSFAAIERGDAPIAQPMFATFCKGGP